MKIGRKVCELRPFSPFFENSCISHFDQFFMKLPCIFQNHVFGVLTNNAVNLQFTSAYTKLVCSIYRMKIGGIEFEL